MSITTVLVGLRLVAPAATACPEAVLGNDTSEAVLTAVTVSDTRPYVLHLGFEVSDHPKTQSIVVDGKQIRAGVVHETPVSLAAWSRHLALQMGGASKFVVGGIMTTDTKEVALVPYSSVLSMRIGQGDDFDASAPFQVEVDLVLLHRPEPFQGERQPFVPWTGLLEWGGERYEALPAVPGGDPYGLSYGDYFADPALVLSFVHGPRFAEPAVEGGQMGSQTPYQDWRSGAMPQAGLKPQDSLYEFIGRTYGAIQPTTTLASLQGHPVVFSLVGDRTLYPPSSPWRTYRMECEFVPGRTGATARSPIISTWIDRAVQDSVLWEKSDALLPGGGAGEPRTHVPGPQMGHRTDQGPRLGPGGPGGPGKVDRERHFVHDPRSTPGLGLAFWIGLGVVMGGVLGVLGAILGRRWFRKLRG